MLLQHLLSATPGRFVAVAAMTYMAAVACAKKSEVVLKVGDDAISRSEYEAIVAAPPAGQREPNATVKAQLTEDLIDEAVLAQETERLDLDESDDVRLRLRQERRRILARAYLDDLAAKHLSDDALRAYYQEHIDQFKSTRAAVSHILLRAPAGATEKQRAAIRAKAASIAKQARSGADFKALARKHSEDPSSAKVGGYLGSVGADHYFREAVQAAIRLKSGEVSDPVLSPHGYHIVRLDEGPRETVADFVGIKSALAVRRRQEVRQEVLADLKQKVRVEILADDLRAQLAHRQAQRAPGSSR